MIKYCVKQLKSITYPYNRTEEVFENLSEILIKLET